MKDWEDNRGKNLKVQKVFWRNCLVRYIMYDCDVAKVQLALYHFEALKALKCHKSQHCNVKKSFIVTSERHYAV